MGNPDKFTSHLSVLPYHIYQRLIKIWRTYEKFIGGAARIWREREDPLSVLSVSKLPELYVCWGGIGMRVTGDSEKIDPRVQGFQGLL